MNTRGTQPRTIHLSTVTALNDHLDIATGIDHNGTPGIWVLNYDEPATLTHPTRDKEHHE